MATHCLHLCVPFLDFIDVARLQSAYGIVATKKREDALAAHWRKRPVFITMAWVKSRNGVWQRVITLRAEKQAYDSLNLLADLIEQCSAKPLRRSIVRLYKQCMDVACAEKPIETTRMLRLVYEKAIAIGNMEKEQRIFACFTK